MKATQTTGREHDDCTPARYAYKADNWPCYYVATQEEIDQEAFRADGEPYGVKMPAWWTPSMPLLRREEVES